MCDTCGCNVTQGNEHLLEDGGQLSRTRSGTESFEVLKGLLDANDQQAEHNRQHFAEHGVLAINLMSSPGAGKTALLEATIEGLQERYRAAVIVGDLETENDAERIRRHGVAAIQISTGSACHLDAHMLHFALHDLDLREVDFVFIENVGNLVCPASFDLGQHLDVALLSSPEGDDKPQKYPVLFRQTDLLLLTKSDLTELLGDFDPKRAEHHLRELANEAPVIEISSRNGQGMESWTAWLERALKTHRAKAGPGIIKHAHSHG